MTKLVNLTPHDINLVSLDNDRPVLTIEASGVMARVAVTRKPGDTLNIGDTAISTSSAVYGAVTGLPGPEEDTLYLVSALVAQAAPNRVDLVTPGELVRDEAGRVVGCRGLTYTPRATCDDCDGVAIRRFNSATGTHEFCADHSINYVAWLGEFYGNMPVNQGKKI